jgi:nucleoside-diphosphate-sugar epimerase
VIGIRDFRLSSSDSGLQLRQISEHEPCLPRNSYGKTKLIAEWLLSDVENVSVIRLNTCYTDDWSSGKGLVGGLVRRSRLEGQVILDNMGRALRDPLHVRDLAALLLSVFEQSFFGKLIHAGGGQENFVTLKEICKLANNNVVINSGQESDDYGFLMDIGLASSIGWSPKVHFRTWINRI